MSMTKNKFFRLIKVFFFDKIDFTFPRKVDVIFYDQYSTILNKFTKITKNYLILPVRGERYNFYALLLTLIKFKISREDYIKSYFDLFRPTASISLSEHDITFYKLKNYFPHVKFIMVQNGCRSKNYDLTDLLRENCIYNKNLEIDFFFLFNKHYAKEYKKFIKFKPVILGSFKSNDVSKTILNPQKKSVIFISQYLRKIIINGVFLDSKSNKKVNKDFWCEQFILPILDEFCHKNNMNFKILLRSYRKNSSNEVEFYSKLIKKNKNYLVYKKKSTSSYKVVDSYENVVFIDSSLGYESIGRNKKIVCIKARKVKNVLRSNFLWPKRGPMTSSFYTHKLEKKKILSLFNKNFTMQYKDWKKKNNKYINDLISYKLRNKIFYSVVANILKNQKKIY